MVNGKKRIRQRLQCAVLILLMLACLAGIAVILTASEHSRRQQETLTARVRLKEESEGIDLSGLREENGDVIAWLSGPDGELQEPVVRGIDNRYYLRRWIDGSACPAGTVFLDCRNASDLSDPVLLLYGHNMKDGSRFGTLGRYREPEYLQQNPELELLTPEHRRSIRLIACILTGSDAALYRLPETREETESYRAQLEETSLSGSGTLSDGQIILLSTCSYEFRGARTVLIGILEPV